MIYFRLQLLILISFALRLLFAHVALPSEQEIQWLLGDENPPLLVKGVMSVLQLGNPLLELRVFYVVTFSISLYLLFHWIKNEMNAKVAIISCICVHCIPQLILIGSSANGANIDCLVVLAGLYMTTYTMKKGFPSIVMLAALVPAIVLNSFLLFLVYGTLMSLLLYFKLHDQVNKKLCWTLWSVAFILGCFVIEGSSFISVLQIKNHYHFFEVQEMVLNSFFLLTPWMLGFVVISVIVLLFVFNDRSQESNNTILGSVLVACLLAFIGYLVEINDELSKQALLSMSLIFISITIGYLCQMTGLYSKLFRFILMVCMVLSALYYYISWNLIRYEGVPSKIVHKASSQLQKKLIQHADHYLKSYTGLKSLSKSENFETKMADFYFSDDKSLSLQLQFYTGSKVYHFGKDEYNEDGSGEYLGKTALFISDQFIPVQDLNFKSHFSKVSFKKEIVVSKGDKMIKQFYLYYCHELKIPLAYKLQPQS